ncbi:MAG: hypothetical protein CL912_15240 [Deltaproteobacteria bacterium]|nr:hypothetical protein [Deltaproteobacteria bacterium]
MEDLFKALLLYCSDTYQSSQYNMGKRMSPLPALADLPLRKGDPPNSAWGLWSDEKATSLGSLNYLTADILLKTTKEEVQTGDRVGLE